MTTTSTTTSQSLQGLPPLPNSLQGLVSAGSAQWKETEKIHSVKSSIQQDIPKTNTIKRPNLVVQNGMICFSDGDMGGQKARKDDKTNKVPVNNNKHSLESAIAFLRHEMVALRQMDSSILCQLMSLNESVQEYKHSALLLHGDRFSETNSTCSSRSLDQGLDGITEEEYSDYDNFTFHKVGNGPRIYENIDFVSGGVRLSGGGHSRSGSVKSSKVTDNEDYLEPVSWQEDKTPTPTNPSQSKAPPLWNLPPQLSLELLSLPPPPPLPLSSPPHSPPIPASPQQTLLSPNDSSTSLSSRSSASSVKVMPGQTRSPGTPKDNKWPGYLLLNSSTSYESAC